MEHPEAGAGRNGIEKAPAVRPLRVLIADDHFAYQHSLARRLRVGGIDVIGQVLNGEAAIRAAEEMAPDVVVMDLNMPGISGLEATSRLIERVPASRVILLSASAREQDLTAALGGGAAAYMVKETPIDEVIDGIRAVAGGEAFVSRPVAVVLLRRVRQAIHEDDFSPSTRLSGREILVLGLLAKGRSHQEIAEALAMPAGAVSDHAGDIIMKLRHECGPDAGSGQNGDGGVWVKATSFTARRRHRH